MAEQTLNLPQVIAVVIVGFLVVRWFMSSNRSGTAGTRGGRQLNLAHIEQVHSMFPQFDRRTIAWDLQQNGGSVQATTEKVLSGRALAQPPPSFQPQLPISAADQGQPGSRSGDTKAPLPDLISRYDLSSKISSKGKEPAHLHDDATKKTGWSQNKTERSELFRRRREEMILAARRKMEAKDGQIGT